jgi:hypothetical protein
MSKHPETPPNASALYVQLHMTALAFIDAQAQTTDAESRMSFDQLESLCAPNYQHSWGHNFATSLSPRVQGTHSFTQFKAHLEVMMPNLKSWDTTVTDITVDELRKKVVLRASFFMVAKGAQLQVENDLLWMLEMDEEGKRIQKSVEFIDGIAAGKLKEMIEKNRQ